MTKTIPFAVAEADATIVYGDHTIDLASLPSASLLALTRRGLTHFLGNEQASKVSGWIKRRTEEKPVEGQPAPLGAPNDAEIAAYRADKIAEAVAALSAGTIGQRAVGEPKASPVDAEVKRLAVAEVMAVLVSNGMAKSGAKGMKADASLTFNAGTADETVVTFGDLVARRIDKHGDRLRTEAEREIARREREAAKVAKGVDGTAASELLG